MSAFKKVLLGVAMGAACAAQAQAAIAPATAMGYSDQTGNIYAPITFDAGRGTYSASYQWDPTVPTAGPGDIESFSFTGYSDPKVVYSFGVVNNTTAVENFSFTFAVPTIPVVGPTRMKDSLQGTLTANSDAGGATVTPAVLNGLQAPYVQDGNGVTNLTALNLGGVLGPTPGAPGSGGTQYTYGAFYAPGPTAASFMAGPVSLAAGWTKLGVTVAFSLTPGDSFSANGYVELDPVPEPSTWVLLAGGLGLLGVIGRRRTQA